MREKADRQNRPLIALQSCQQYGDWFWQSRRFQRASVEPDRAGCVRGDVDARYDQLRDRQSESEVCERVFERR